MRKICLIIVLLVVFFTAYGQKDNVDSLFLKAKETAFSKQYTEAINLCDKIVQISPSYVDAYILNGRVNAWQKNYQEARQQFEKALKLDPSYKDANIAASTLELWDKKYDAALEKVNMGLSYIDNDVDLLVLKIKILYKQGFESLADHVLGKAIQLYPKNEELKLLSGKLVGETYKNQVYAIYSFDFFNKPWIRRWHVLSFQYSRKAVYGSIIPRVNIGSLVNDQNSFMSNPSYQYEIDLYPKLGKGRYAYLNFGYSDDKGFPKYRGGAEYFQSLPLSMEASAGFRCMQFVSSIDGSRKNAYIYTGAVGKYYRNYWLSFRAFISPKSNSDNVSQSYFLFVRRYFSSANNFITLILGRGRSPDDLISLTGDIETYRFTNYNVKLEYQHVFRDRFILKVSLGDRFEEYKPKERRSNMSFTTNFSYRF